MARTDGYIQTNKGSHSNRLPDPRNWPLSGYIYRTLIYFSRESDLSTGSPVQDCPTRLLPSAGVKRGTCESAGQNRVSRNDARKYSIQSFSPNCQPSIRNNLRYGILYGDELERFVILWPNSSIFIRPLFRHQSHPLTVWVE
jgi:hypothetical protein